MWKVRLDYSQTNRLNQYRLWSNESMTAAYQKVKNGQMSIGAAAKQYGIPKTTLIDRVSGRVAIETTRSGPSPLLEKDQEARLVNHIKKTASYGYGYTRQEVINLGTDLAVSVGYRDNGHPLSEQWYANFMTRWPEIKRQKPRSLSKVRAEAASQQCISHYFSELQETLTKYDLHNRPECVYNVDEKGINLSHTPPNVVAATKTKPSAINNERSETITIIGAGNALGNAIPPFFVFKGSRMNQDLLEGTTPGTIGCVSDSGWSNTEIFEKYMKTHFLKYVQGLNQTQKIIVLYDGHKSHVSLSLIEWAREKGIVLFVLPAHTSHILQPLDVCCYGPLSKILNKECHSFVRQNHANLTKQNIASLACKAYSKGLSPENLRAAFKKTGICPFDDTVIDPTVLLPSIPLKRPSDTADAVPAVDVVLISNTLADPAVAVLDDSLPVSIDPNPVVVAPEVAQQVASVYTAVPVNIDLFFEEKDNSIIKNTLPPKKKRKVLSRVVSGKELTSSETVDKIQLHKSTQPPVKVKTAGKEKCTSKGKGKSKQVKSRNFVVVPKKENVCVPHHCPSSPVAGPSAFYVSSSESYESEIGDSELCCVCGRFAPEAFQTSTSVMFLKWGECMHEGCGHWTHLRFCCDVNVLRRHSVFTCPCHTLPCIEE